ncbi:Periplasmic copper-binding protein (NosD) [uncultured archaeon]|nr:Periplasmic copper-binding protein (NosD) [uncultured archaeon]
MRSYLIVALILLIAASTATEIKVAPHGAAYSSLEAALNNASSGDVIEVFSGTYNGSVYVDKQVELKGIDTGGGLPVIDAHSSGSAITLSADGIALEGFNLTNSGHCGCGNAGIYVDSNNNTILHNIAYKDKYGIYIKPGKTGNRLFLNNLADSSISSYDGGNNSWDGSTSAGMFGLLKRMAGNYYGDIDSSAYACNDSNKDGICDIAKAISGGSSIDHYPLANPEGQGESSVPWGLEAWIEKSGQGLAPVRSPA